jgi:hypothetical protein
MCNVFESLLKYMSDNYQIHSSVFLGKEIIAGVDRWLLCVATHEL